MNNDSLFYRAALKTLFIAAFSLLSPVLIDKIIPEGRGSVVVRVWGPLH